MDRNFIRIHYDILIYSERSVFGDFFIFIKKRGIGRIAARKFQT